jgi:hypothetical protein
VPAQGGTPLSNPAVVRHGSPGAFVLAGTSTSIAGSPTVHDDRKNSSYLQSTQPPIGPTPMRLA